MKRTGRWRQCAELLDIAHAGGRCLVAARQQEIRALRARVAEGVVVEPHPRVFAAAAWWGALNPIERERSIILSLSLRHPDLVFCSFSAAVMHRLPVSYRLLGKRHVVTIRHTRSSPFVQRHRVDDLQWVYVDGVRVTPFVNTAVDCMRAVPFADGLVFADALLRRLVVERELLQEMVERLCRRRQGVDRAREAARWADGRAESGGESIARAQMIMAGIPPSDLQVSFANPVDERSEFRSDFLFRLVGGLTVLGELDGNEKYREEQAQAENGAVEALVRERQRESRLSMLGMPIVRFAYADTQAPGRIARLLAAAGVVPEALSGPDYRATALRPPTYGMLFAR